MKHSNRIIFITTLLLIVGVFSNFILIHPMHISVTEIHYSEEKANFEIAIKIFADDLERGIEDIGATEIKLNQDKESKNADDWVKEYLNQTLNIIVNNKERKAQYLGKEYDKHAVWSYLEVKNLSTINSLKIENVILQNVFKDQKNLIHFYKNKKRIQTSILNHKKTEIPIDL